MSIRSFRRLSDSAICNQLEIDKFRIGNVLFPTNYLAGDIDGVGVTFSCRANGLTGIGTAVECFRGAKCCAIPTTLCLRPCRVDGRCVDAVVDDDDAMLLVLAVMTGGLVGGDGADEATIAVGAGGGNGRAASGDVNDIVVVGIESSVRNPTSDRRL